MSEEALIQLNKRVQELEERIKKIEVRYVFCFVLI